MGWRWKSSFIKVTTFGEIIGVEEGLFFLVVMSVLGRAKPDRG
jgi:hypothetical protein